MQMMGSSFRRKKQLQDAWSTTSIIRDYRNRCVRKRSASSSSASAVSSSSSSLLSLTSRNSSGSSLHKSTTTKSTTATQSDGSTIQSSSSRRSTGSDISSDISRSDRTVTSNRRVVDAVPCTSIPENKPMISESKSSSRSCHDTNRHSSSNSNNDDLMSIASVSTITTTIQLTNPTTIADNSFNYGEYTGSVNKRSGLPHGKGTMRYKDVVYEGQWVNGDWSGYGRLKDLESNDVYQGGFFDNRKHGLGVMTYSDGRIYEGTFQLGHLQRNKCHVTFPDGTTYWGRISPEGIPHGRGKKVFPDGKVFDGEFHNDIMQGHGKMTYPDGHWYLGEWSDGKANGLGLQVLKDGSVEFEGMYSNGRPTISSSFPNHSQLSKGRFLCYRSSYTTLGDGCRSSTNVAMNCGDGGGGCAQSRGTLVGPLRPEHIYMKKRIMKFAL